MPVNALLVRWVGGWTEVARGGRRREACLGLGAEQTYDEARRIANVQLDNLADPRTEVAVDPKPRDETELPFLAFRPGDFISAADWDGAMAEQRVLSLGCAVDDNWMITYSIELHDRILGERERTEQAMKKMTNGTLRGSSKVATPTGMVGKRNLMLPRPSGGGKEGT
jgi:hypothetical protein